MAPGEQRRLSLIAWMPEGVDVRYEGLSASARLDLRAGVAK
jgi:hypothetical protein